MDKCSRLGRYELGELVKDSSTYKIYFDVTGKYVIKIVELEIKREREYFRYEAKAIKKISSLGIAAPLVDAWECKQKPRYGVIVTERLSIALEDYVDDLTLSPQDSINIALAINRANEMMIQAGVVHGDLHGGNIFLDPMPRHNSLKLSLVSGVMYMYIIDFDLAAMPPDLGLEDISHHTIQILEHNDSIIKDTLIAVLEKSS